MTLFECKYLLPARQRATRRDAVGLYPTRYYMFTFYKISYLNHKQTSHLKRIIEYYSEVNDIIIYVISIVYVVVFLGSSSSKPPPFMDLILWHVHLLLDNDCEKY
jgi:hypothetical protein